MINNMKDQDSGLREMAALEIEHGVRVFAVAAVARKHLAVRLESVGYRQLADRLMRCACPEANSSGVENFMYRLMRTCHLNVVDFTV